MHKPLTTEQKEKITILYRERGWSIKKIAKHLHIGDKRVSAFLCGKPCGCGCNKKPAKQETDEFLITGKGLVKAYEKACNNFVEVVYKTILEEISDLLTTKKVTKKECEKHVDARLNRLFNSAMNMTYSAGCAAIFSMPPRLKRMWLENLLLLENLLCDPKEAMKKRASTKKTKK